MKQLTSRALIACALLSIPQLSATSQTTRSIPNLDLFFLPLRMTPNGIKDFFELMYNTKYYQDFLSENFTHLIQYINHGKLTNQGPEWVKSTLALFRQKLKGCRYVDAAVFSNLLAQLPQSIDYVFVNQNKTQEFQRQAIKQALYHEFLNHFEEFKKDPATFFDSLTNTIMSDLNAEQGQISTECLRQSVIRFIETGLGKLAWEVNGKEIWKNVTEIADHLASLYDAQIITDLDELNDLYWSLIHRLADFMDATAPALTPEFYETLHAAVTSPEHPLLMLQEQDDLAITKREVLERALIDSYAKKQAFEQGLITD